MINTDYVKYPLISYRERPLMMSDFRGGSEMTPKNWTSEGKNRTLKGDRGSKIVKNRRTSYMEVSLGAIL